MLGCDASGREVFFNQLIAAYKGWNDARNTARNSVCFGSGEAIDPEDLALTSELAYAASYDINWQRGDVALVDNYTMMHGRRPFTGRRRVLASLVGAT